MIEYEEGNKITAITAKEKEFESANLDKLYSALAKAQEEMEIATTDKNNPFFKSKYADLHSIVRASRPSLTKNGLSIMQRITTSENDNMYLNTRLCHASGQWIESKMPIKPADYKIQSIGSYITYLKRYTLAAIVGVATDDANDDDGEKAMDRSKKKEVKAPVVVQKITKKQVKDLEDMLFVLPDYKKTINDFLGKQGILTNEDIPIETYDKIIKKAKQLLKQADEDNENY